MELCGITRNAEDTDCVLREALSLIHFLGNESSIYEFLQETRNLHKNFLLLLCAVGDPHSSLQSLAGLKQDIFRRVFGFLVGSVLMVTKAARILALKVPS
jgi:hypothetical protein